MSLIGGRAVVALLTYNRLHITSIGDCRHTPCPSLQMEHLSVALAIFMIFHIYRIISLKLVQNGQQYVRAVFASTYLSSKLIDPRIDIKKFPTSTLTFLPLIQCICGW